MVAALLFQLFDMGAGRWNFDADRSPDGMGNGHADFVDGDLQRIAVPRECAWTKTELPVIAVECCACALGHGPTLLAAIESHIDGTMAFRVCGCLAPCPFVVGREHAADEGNHGEAIQAIIADAIGIPPVIAIQGNLTVKPWSAQSAWAASCPEIAAIGTPAPGCAEPPAR